MNKYFIHCPLNTCLLSFENIEDACDRIIGDEISGTVSVLNKKTFNLIPFFVNHTEYENPKNWFRIKAAYMNTKKDNNFALKARVEIQLKWILKFIETDDVDYLLKATNFENVYVDEVELYLLLLDKATKLKKKQKEYKSVVKFLENEIEF